MFLHGWMVQAMYQYAEAVSNFGSNTRISDPMTRSTDPGSTDFCDGHALAGNVSHASHWHAVNYACCEKC